MLLCRSAIDVSMVQLLHWYHNLNRSELQKSEPLIEEILDPRNAYFALTSLFTKILMSLANQGK